MKFVGLNIKRLNRRSYFLSVISSMFIFVAVGLIVGALIDLATGRNGGEPNAFGLIPFMILWFVYFGFLSVMRLHDLNMNGWLALLLLIPYIGFGIGAMLTFMPGKEENRFGEEPARFYMAGFSMSSKADA